MAGASEVRYSMSYSHQVGEVARLCAQVMAKNFQMSLKQVFASICQIFKNLKCPPSTRKHSHQVGEVTRLRAQVVDTNNL